MHSLLRARFTDAEWRHLLFAVLDTYWLAATIDGAIDALEEEALAEALSHPQLAESALMGEVLASMAGQIGELVAGWHPGRRGPAQQEAAFRRVAALLDAKVDARVASAFKSALVDLGMNVANASGLPAGNGGRLSAIEITVLAAISEWLGVDES